MGRAQGRPVAFRKHTGSVFLCAALLLVLTHLPRMGAYGTLEDMLTPLRLALRSARRGPAPAVDVLVVQGPGEERSPEAMAALVRAAGEGGAAAIGLALPARELEDGEAWTPLVEAMASHPTVLSAPLLGAGGARRLEEPPDRLADAAAAVAYTWPRVNLRGQPTGLYLHGLTRNRARMGTAVDLFRLYRGIPAFNVLLREGGLLLKPLPDQRWEALEIPLGGEGVVPVNARFLDSFPRLEDAALLAGGPAVAAGRIVVLDAPSEAGVVTRPSPVGRTVTDGEVLACVLGSMLAGEVDVLLPWPAEALGIALVALVLVVVGLLRSPGGTVAVGGVLLVAWWGAGLAAYLEAGLLLPLVRPSVLLALLTLAGVLRHLYRPVLGVQVDLDPAAAEKEAQTALGLGIKLLQKGQVDESIKYFQKVAGIQSSMRGRSQYFLSLVLLRQGDTETASTLISAMDFASLTQDEAYTLARELETRGDLNTAHTLYESLVGEEEAAEEAEEGFRDVAQRLQDLEKRLSSISEQEIVETMVRKVVDRRFGEIQMVGRGGMGFVYRGKDAYQEGREVALKVLSPFFANHDTIRVRFLREAALAAQLVHPSIVRIFDVFDVSLPYYSMEYIGALSVKEILAGVGRFEAGEAVDLVLQVCEGLALAHGRGVVHRDIKPDNLVLDEARRVKVIDFGIAKILDADDLTGTQKRMGTPEYMSPEQVRAEPLDERSDIYSLGVVLYEMLTGSVPFRKLRDHVDAPVPSLPPTLGLPRELNAALRRTMAKDRGERHASMDELHAELVAVRASLPAAPTGGGGA